jgi:hypothetical protein
MSCPSDVVLDTGSVRRKGVSRISSPFSTAPSQAGNESWNKATIDQSGFVNSAELINGWTGAEIRTYSCAVHTTAYRYFRLNITANNGANPYTMLAE